MDPGPRRCIRRRPAYAGRTDDVGDIKLPSRRARGQNRTALWRIAFGSPAPRFDCAPAVAGRRCASAARAAAVRCCGSPSSPTVTGATGSACGQTYAHGPRPPDRRLDQAPTAPSSSTRRWSPTGLAARGIGNRPGLWNFLSGPKFPYGKRQMALPIWADSRGKPYPTVVMQDNRGVGGRAISARAASACTSLLVAELYYCRPLAANLGFPGRRRTIVDAVTCPCQVQQLEGHVRPDLRRSSTRRATISAPGPRRDGIRPPDASRRSTISTRSPRRRQPTGNPTAAPGTSPPPGGGRLRGLGRGQQGVRHQRRPRSPGGRRRAGGPSYGVDGNFGQPSVVYRVPIRLDGTTALLATGRCPAHQGYSDWTGTAARHPARRHHQPASRGRVRGACWR